MKVLPISHPEWTAMVQVAYHLTAGDAQQPDTEGIVSKNTKTALSTHKNDGNLT